jgi:hypothetical protein
MNIKNLVYWVLGLAIGGLLLIQLVPYGRNHNNPPVLSEPNWDSPDTRALAKTACFDCHSNETDWNRWYTKVAPASWLVQHDVDEGRRVVNFSEWNQNGKPRELGELIEATQEGFMPPKQYLILHPEAKLTQDQINQLVNGFRTTLSNK